MKELDTLFNWIMIEWEREHSKLSRTDEHAEKEYIIGELHGYNQLMHQINILRGIK